MTDEEAAEQSNKVKLIKNLGEALSDGIESIGKSQEKLLGGYEDIHEDLIHQDYEAPLDFYKEEQKPYIYVDGEGNQLPGWENDQGQLEDGQACCNWDQTGHWNKEDGYCESPDYKRGEDCWFNEELLGNEDDFRSSHDMWLQEAPVANDPTPQSEEEPAADNTWLWVVLGLAVVGAGVGGFFVWKKNQK
jgi:hypothetical protein